MRGRVPGERRRRLRRDVGDDVRGHLRRESPPQRHDRKHEESRRGGAGLKPAVRKQLRLDRLQRDRAARLVVGRRFGDGRDGRHELASHGGARDARGCSVDDRRPSTGRRHEPVDGRRRPRL